MSATATNDQVRQAPQPQILMSLETEVKTLKDKESKLLDRLKKFEEQKLRDAQAAIKGRINRLEQAEIIKPVLRKELEAEADTIQLSLDESGELVGNPLTFKLDAYEKLDPDKLTNNEVNLGLGDDKTKKATHPSATDGASEEETDRIADWMTKGRHSRHAKTVNK